MLNILYRLLLSISATSWFILVFCAKYFVSIQPWLYWLIIVSIFALSLAITIGTICLSKKLPNDQLNEYNELELIDNEGMPIYLGFFFVALSIDQLIVAIIVYTIIVAFVNLTHALYFNPLFIIFGYHFYKGKTINGVCHVLIIKGEVIKITKSLPKHAKRINNISFISKREN